MSSVLFEKFNRLLNARLSFQGFYGFWVTAERRNTDLCSSIIYVTDSRLTINLENKASSAPFYIYSARVPINKVTLNIYIIFQNCSELSERPVLCLSLVDFGWLLSRGNVDPSVFLSSSPACHPTPRPIICVQRTTTSAVRTQLPLFISCFSFPILPHSFISLLQIPPLLCKCPALCLQNLKHAYFSIP